MQNKYIKQKNTELIRIINYLLLPFCLFTSIALAQTGLDKLQHIHKEKPEFVEGEILVEFKQGIDTAQQMEAVLSSLGSRSQQVISRRMRSMRVKLPQEQSVQQAIIQYQANTNIKHAQPNYIYSATATPNDSQYGQLWGLKNSGQTITNSNYTLNNPGTPGADIDAELAWDEITDCSSVIVAVLDTGIDYTHQDLVANIWDGSALGYPNHGIDFVDIDNDPIPTGGGEHHGTHVAGTIGAISNNANATTGICWNASIMSVRVLDETGSGNTADIIMGIEFSADNGAGVMNMSFGAEIPLDQLFSNAITYAQARDVVVVVAAGNGGLDGVGDDNDGPGDDGDTNTMFYPCNFTHDNLICAAALDQAYSLTTFSNYGATDVDVGAPGANILSNYPGYTTNETFVSSWTLTGNWNITNCSGALPFNILVDPADWCTLGLYMPNADDRAYKGYDISGVNAASFTYGGLLELGLGDYFFSAYDATGNDPFDGTDDVQLDSITNGYYELISYHDLSGCLTSSCAIGFRLQSDGIIGADEYGIAIVPFTIDSLVFGTNITSLGDGTSMASSHVAGVATMVRAYNPDYTYSDTVAAIKGGGESASSLTGKTSTGMAINAMGSLAYINPPTGISVTQQ